jgi:hypothetical protein
MRQNKKKDIANLTDTRTLTKEKKKKKKKNDEIHRN